MLASGQNTRELVLDLRRLKRFVKIVDVGSLSRAADVMNIAQPALSQQLASLEAELNQQLLVRSKRGVVPTEAGAILYRHAQAILRQIDQAKSDVGMAGQTLSGSVSVGLGGIGISTIAMPLLLAVRARHPGILLYINDSFGTTLSELVMTGKIDMAVVYGDGRVRGLHLDPLIREPLVLVARKDQYGDRASIQFAELAEFDLLLPRKFNYIRRVLDKNFDREGVAPRIVAELETGVTIAQAVTAAIGVAILPFSAASVVCKDASLCHMQIEAPSIDVPIAMCTSDTLPLTVPSSIVKGIVLDLIQGITNL